MLAPHLWKEAQAVLNGELQRASGEDAAFLIHYWGAAPELLSNRPHKHSFFEMCYCTDGEGFYHELGQIRPIRAGTMFLSRPGVPHQITVPPEARLSLLYVAFQPVPNHCLAPIAQAFADLQDAGRTLIAEEAGDDPAGHVWLALLRQAAEGPGAIPVLLKASAYALLLSLPHVFEDALSRSKPLPNRSATSRTVEQALLFLRDNCSEPLQLSHIADYLHVSVRHLSRLMQTELGMTIGEALRKERVKLGAELLAEGELPIKEIAERAGFGSVHYFTRVFTQEMGMSPGIYRRRGIRA